MTRVSKQIFWGTAGTIVAIFPAMLWAHVEGPDARHSGAPGDAKFSCADAGQCHTALQNGGPVNASGGGVTATFSTGSTYTPGSGPITITVNATDPVNTSFGFQMSARLDSNLIEGQAGYFIPSANQLVMCDYLSVQYMDLPEPAPNSCGVDVNGLPSVEFVEQSFPKGSFPQATPYTFQWMPPATNVGPVHFYVAGNVVNDDQMADAPDHVYTNSYVLTAGAPLPPPTVAAGGVLNAASFAKGSNGLGLPVAPGSLVAIFGSNLGSAQADATGAPFGDTLGNVSVTLNNIPMPLRDVFPALPYPSINAQVPFGVLASGQTSATVPIVVTVNGVASDPQQVQIVTQAPGIFTIPSGAGNAVLVNLTDFSIAAPTGSITGLTTHPIPRGTKAFFYATGLGIMSPPVADGAGEGATGTPTAESTPVVMIGGITAPVTFAGQAPGYPGVSQVNVTIPANAPTGSAVSLQIQSADGSVVSAAKISTIAIQ
jgi:uncharacterized protein (TIGR03437 family)